MGGPANCWPSGGSDRVGTASITLGVSGDGCGHNGTGRDGWTEESEPWSSGGGPMPGFRHRNRKNETGSKGERCSYLKTDNDPSSTTHNIFLSSNVCSYFEDFTWRYSRAPFVRGVPVVDASAAASAEAPAAATVTGSGVVPAAPVRGAAGCLRLQLDRRHRRHRWRPLRRRRRWRQRRFRRMGPGGRRQLEAVSPPRLLWTGQLHDQPPETGTT